MNKGGKRRRQRCLRIGGIGGITKRKSKWKKRNIHQATTEKGAEEQEGEEGEEEEGEEGRKKSKNGKKEGCGEIENIENRKRDQGQKG